MDSHKNFAYSTVATVPSPASSGTSLVVASGGGSLFPSVPFNATVWPAGVQPSASNAEIVRVTAVSSDTFTITRAQESSAARAIVAGDQISATVTTKTLTDIESAIPASTASLPDSADKRYVTDAELVVLGNTSGVNTGDQTSVSGNAGTATALQTSRNIDGQAFDGTTNVTVIAPGTHAATSKATPVDADELSLVDSAASNVLKKLTWANVKATLKTYFDGLYLGISASAGGDLTGSYPNPRVDIDGRPPKAIPVGADELLIADSDNSFVLRKLTWTNLKAGITTITGNSGTATALQTARNIDGQSFDGTANITVIAPGTHAATGKTTPVDADELPLVDSAASNVLKKLTWANLKATLKTYFDGLYGPVSSVTSANDSIAVATTTTTPVLTVGTVDKLFTNSAPAADLAMNSHKLTGLSAGSTAGDSLRYEQLATSAMPGGWSGTFDLVSSSTTTNIFSQSIPANTLGANGAILGIVSGFYLNNSGASRGLSLGVQFGATNVWFDASNATAFGASATVYPFFMEFLIANEGATNAQRLSGFVMIASPNAASVAGQGVLSTNSLVSTPFHGTSAIDTTSAANLIVRAKHSASDANLELKGSVHYRVIT